MFNKKEKCEACHKNNLPKDPAKVILDTHEFRICEDCERLWVVIEDKFKHLSNNNDEAI